MHFRVGACSETGSKRSDNQDGILVKSGTISGKRVLLAAVCDGMGGLSNGGMASSKLIDALEWWFVNIFPKLITNRCNNNKIVESIKHSIDLTGEELNIYVKKRGIRLGTTVAALLIKENHYIWLNVGDSRVYKLDSQCRQLSSDHALSQYQNILLRCVGAMENPKIDVGIGKVSNSDMFLICSDGFRHKITSKEIYENMYTKGDDELLTSCVRHMIYMDEKRGEEDNISAILIGINSEKDNYA